MLLHDRWLLYMKLWLFWPFVIIKEPITIPQMKKTFTMAPALFQLCITVCCWANFSLQSLLPYVILLYFLSLTIAQHCVSNSCWIFPKRGFTADSRLMTMPCYQVCGNSMKWLVLLLLKGKAEDRFKILPSQGFMESELLCHFYQKQASSTTWVSLLFLCKGPFDFCHKHQTLSMYSQSWWHNVLT